ncbi:MAG: GGDEF domain-containing protein [bacterium]
MNKQKNKSYKIFAVLDESEKNFYKSFIKDELEEYNIMMFDSFNRAYYSVYASPPNLIIIVIGSIMQKNELEYKKELKMINDMQIDNMLSNIPILFIIPPDFDFKSIASSEKYILKDYIKEPLSKNELKYKTESIIKSSKSALDANPLTKLPGNSSIIESVKTKLDEDIDFAFAYIDIDNFKSYNDKYGFLRGDEVIMMTSRLIATTVYDISKAKRRNIEKYVFIGHIGGDDFVIMSHNEDILEISNNIIANFDKIILSFYDNTDKERGYIEAYGRQKNLQRFPVMSLSIAIIENVNKKITHYGQISEIASGLKKAAKDMPGSNIITDRRNPESGGVY